MTKKIILALLTIVAVIVMGIYLYLSPKIQYDSSKYPWQGFSYQSINAYMDHHSLSKKNLDRESFTLLSDGLAFDKNQIYYLDKILDKREAKNIEELKQAFFNNYVQKYPFLINTSWDIQSFQILDFQKGIARDNNHVFFKGKIVPNISNKSLQILEDTIYTDGNSLYFNSTKLNNIDLKSLKIFNKYILDKNRSYYFQSPTKINITYDIDYESFEVLDTEYAKDKNYLYFLGKRVPNINPLQIQRNSFDMLHDGKNIIFKAAIIMDSDIETYQPLFPSNYATDLNYVYYNNQRILGSGSQGFELIENSEYAKDKNYVYKDGIIINEDIDAPSFKLIEHQWFKDKDHIYYTHQLLENADTASFLVLNEQLAKDKNNVYFKEDPVKNADAASFVMINQYFAKDHHKIFYSISSPHIYSREEVSHPASFQEIKDPYYKDINTIYYNYSNDFLVPLENIDSMSFVDLGFGYLKDKNGIYFLQRDHRISIVPAAIQIIEADIKTFKVLHQKSLDAHLGTNWWFSYGRSYAKDANHCFINNNQSNCMEGVQDNEK